MKTGRQAKRKVGRPPGVVGKPRGSPKTRRTVKRIAKLILEDCADSSIVDAAVRTGLEPHDIKNLRAGNLPSLQLVLRLVARGHYSPDALIRHGKLRKLPRRTSTRGAQRKLIAARIRRLTKQQDAAQLAKATGLSVYNIYQHRVANKSPGLHTVLGLIDAGVSPSEVFLGRR